MAIPPDIIISISFSSKSETKVSYSNFLKPQQGAPPFNPGGSSHIKYYKQI